MVRGATKEHSKGKNSFVSEDVSSQMFFRNILIPILIALFCDVAFKIKSLLSIAFSMVTHIFLFSKVFSIGR